MNTSRNVMLAIAFFCLAMLGVALYLQHGMNMLPCPLCVIQRYIFLGIALFCLVGATSGIPKVVAALGLLGSIGGMGVAGKHLYILAHPGLSCGIDPMETALNKIATAKYLPFMFRADGLCEDATAPFFGLSIPQWSFVGFAICAVGLIWAMTRTK